MKYLAAMVFVTGMSLSALTPANDASAEAVAPGMQTNAWLTAQKQGTIASANPQAAKPIQRDKAAERFMKTYDFPIKESFYGDTFQSGK